MRTKLRALVVVFFLSVLVPPLSAQSIPVDTASAEGFKAGEKAAQRAGVGGRLATGFGGGFVAGFSAPFAIFGRSPEGFLIGGAGATLVVAAAESGNLLPADSLRRIARTRGQGYRIGFEEGYSSRLQSRRRSAAFMGGVIGVGAGVGTIYYLVTHFLPYT